MRKSGKSVSGSANEPRQIKKANAENFAESFRVLSMIIQKMSGDDNVHSHILSFLLPVQSIQFMLPSKKKADGTTDSEFYDSRNFLGAGFSGGIYFALTFWKILYWRVTAGRNAEEITASTIDLTGLSFPRQAEVSPDGLYMLVFSQDKNLFVYKRDANGNLALLSSCALSMKNDFFYLRKKSSVVWDPCNQSVFFLPGGGEVIFKIELNTLSGPNFQPQKALDIDSLNWVAEWAQMEKVDNGGAALMIRAKTPLGKHQLTWNGNGSEDTVQRIKRSSPVSVPTYVDAAKVLCIESMDTRSTGKLYQLPGFFTVSSGMPGIKMERLYLDDTSPAAVGFS